MVSLKNKQSKKLFQESQIFFPGGVNSPVRAFGSVGGDPLFIKKAQGAYIWDVDGNKFVDFVGAWGPAILGHAHPEVVQTVKQVVELGFGFGAPTEGETKLAAQIQSFFPSMEMMRLVSSGTEACMSAIRVARGFTGRNKVLKFDGCYHGHGDALLAKAGSGAATLGIPGSAGVSPDSAKDTITCAYNDSTEIEQAFKQHGSQLACVIVEPVVGNAGFIKPKAGYLKELQALCKQHGALLIFDEVMTGFRVAPGGVQTIEGIKPDLTTLGKIVGGGMPLAAYGGRKDIMQQVAPLGPVYQAGTLSGNPIAVAAGSKTLELLRQIGNYEQLNAKSLKLCNILKSAADRHKIPFICDQLGGMFGFFFSERPVHSFAEAKASRSELFRNFFWQMLESGIYFPPSPFEACFMSFAHSDADFERVNMAADRVFANLK